jgi:regulator of protease activity HflC (stomatin/prohibitin superfamily)
MTVSTTLGRLLVLRAGRQAYSKLKPAVKNLQVNIAIGAVVTVFVALFLLSHIIVVVRSGQAGVLFSLFSGGTVVDTTYGEGIHFILPWNTMHRYDLRVRERTADVAMQTKEGLTIEVGASIRYRIPRDQVTALHVNYGPAYEQVLISPIFLSSIREVIGQYRPEQLYNTAPAEIQEKATTEALREVSRLPIQIDAIVFKWIKLPTQINKAIEAKLIEEQELLRYQFVLEKTYKEALRRVVEAQGIRFYQDGINAGLTENFLRFKGIEATTALAASNNSKIVVVGGKDGLPLILNPDASPASAQAPAAPAPSATAEPPAQTADRAGAIDQQVERFVSSLDEVWNRIISAKIPAKTLAVPTK